MAKNPQEIGGLAVPARKLCANLAQRRFIRANYPEPNLNERASGTDEPDRCHRQREARYYRRYRDASGPVLTAPWRPQPHS